MTRSDSYQTITDMLSRMGLVKTEVRQYSNRFGIPTGVRIATIHDWDQRQHPSISEIAGRLPVGCAVEVVFEETDPDAIWLPRRQPDPWSASMMRGRRR